MLRSKFELKLPYPFQANAISRIRDKQRYKRHMKRDSLRTRSNFNA